LFEKVFGVKFEYSNNPWKSDYIGIGSILQWTCPKGIGIKGRILNTIRYLLGKKGKILVLSAGFRDKPNIHTGFYREMEFKIVRGRLTEKWLLDNGLIKGHVLVGDLGLLSPYLVKTEIQKKYKLGIIPHFKDMSSSLIWDIYKQHEKNCLMINVHDNPEMVIRQIASCESVVSSSLHGLIVADSFGIPNLWIENRWKMDIEPLFKYLDYYSALGITEIKPVQAFDFLYSSIDIIKNQYKIDFKIVKSKQEELYHFCNDYFRKNCECARIT
ncbi:MAG: polysaccharide pyruvyl transferase family protein, partial [Treponema sp.]|nr:polysaccharide pyruvyl transferase family protein [Treponema sp.]